MSILDEIKDYKEGGKDNKGRTISHIYNHSDKYVIYQSEKKLRFDGETEIYDADFEVQSLLQQILALTPSDDKKRNKIFVSVAMGLVACLEKNSDQAKKMLNRTLNRLINKSQQTGQLFYLLGSFIVSFIFILISLIIFIILNGMPTDLQLIIFCITSGALGGLFSVMSNLKKIDVDNDSGTLYLISSGASRILISVVGAFFIFLAIKGDILFPIVEKLNSNYALYAFSFLAGFSEKFVPNKLKTLENH